MIARRELLSGAAFGGLLGGDTAQAGAQQDRVDLSGVVKAIDQLRATLVGERTFPEIADVRDRQKQYLRQQGKLPDFIEVGVDVWFDAYDWHVRTRQPPTVGRDPIGRYTLELMGSVLIMRPDLPSPRYIGAPYDNR
jgi:hypothetical protein